jgi:drug/metabolite transporter (DMT)-like permease
MAAPVPPEFMVIQVAPIVATTPLFSLPISLIFLRGKEQVTGLTIIGAVAVVTGTIAVGR